MTLAEGSLSPTQQAIARSRSYSLFGRILSNGLTLADLPTLQAIPELAVTMPGVFDQDEASADYQHLFGFNIFPHESIFLDPAGLLGGPIGEDVLAVYRNAGYPSDVSSDQADHIGQELGFLAFLCGEEAQAWQAEERGLARHLASLQHDFLSRHLLRWLPPLVLAIQQQDYPFYSALAKLVFLLSISHPSLTTNSSVGFTLPAPADILTDENAGLKEIITHFLTPVYSGLFLSRDDISRLARRGTLPRGFGSRRQMLQNLLRSAANYDEMETIFKEMRLLIDHWHSSYVNLGSGQPVSSFVEPWLTRLTRTTEMLETMLTQLNEID